MNDNTLVAAGGQSLVYATGVAFIGNRDEDSTNKPKTTFQVPKNVQAGESESQGDESKGTDKHFSLQTSDLASIHTIGQFLAFKIDG